MKPWSLEIIVKCNSFSSAEELADSFKMVFDDPSIDCFYNEVTGKSISRSKVWGELKKNRKNDFVYSFSEARFSYGNTGARDNRAGLIYLRNYVGSFQEAEEVLTHLLTDSRFIQARFFDRNYDFWQNAQEIYSYENNGIDHSNLPKKSNGLPKPLEKIVIDTSTNPGRRRLNFDFIESVGAVMWLGNSFWEVTGGRKEAVLNNKEFEVVDHGDWLRIKAQDTPFTQDSGVERERQIALRKLLFPEKN